MKKILLLVVFGLFISLTTFAQGPCAPNVGITFSNVAHAGGTITVWNFCSTPPTSCEYTIPVNTGTQTICLDGVTGVIGGPCTALTLTGAECGSGIRIKIHNYNFSVTNYYDAHYDGSTWTFTLSSGFPQSKWTDFAGNHRPDLVLSSDDNGTIGVSLGFPDAEDDFGAVMTL
jgi:hypothetical protein